MTKRTLPDPPELLKQQEILHGHLSKAEVMVEMLLLQDFTDCLKSKHYLYEYFCIVSNLILEARICSENLISLMLKLSASEDEPLDPDK